MRREKSAPRTRRTRVVQLWCDFFETGVNGGYQSKLKSVRHETAALQCEPHECVCQSRSVVLVPSVLKGFA
jgi:hypothetical protein